LLYFSALDLSRNMNVVGAVDLDAYNSIEGDGEEKIARMDEYLTISDVGSASGAAAQLQDIKALKGPMIGNNEELPVLQSIDFDSDNPYSISLHFSKAMDQSSVESNLQFVNTSSGIGVPYMTLWLGNSLHLLVDLNDFGEAPTEKGLPVTRPLSDGTSYKVILDSAASDRSGNMLANEDPGELTKTVMIDI
ncbi:MAG TPA: Ig-like domain-containing protein, partial [Gammaproteobacteria bacterium]